MLRQNRFEYQNTAEVKLLQRVEECLTEWKDLLNDLVVILADTKKLYFLNFNPDANIIWRDNIVANTLDDGNHYSDIA